MVTESNNRPLNQPRPDANATQQRANNELSHCLPKTDELRSAILAYGAARERPGIERAASVADNFDGPADASDIGNAIRTLPVDGTTP